MIALYERVSTAEQAAEGYSIGEQIERLAAFCHSRGWSNFKHYTDAGYSGGNTNRPALQDMLAAIRGGKITAVIVYKLDRLSRSQKDTLELFEDIFEPNGVDFISVCENFDTGSAFGKAMIGMFSVFAQLEREQIKERVSIGRQARAKEGKWHGGSTSPIGYDYVNGELVVNDFEAMQVREIFKMYLDGFTFTEIATHLNNKGWTHKHGKWLMGRVRSILASPLYAGDVSFGGVWFQGIHTPIIDRITFERASAMLSARPKSKSHKRRPVSEAYLLGKIFCARCGCRYTHQRNKTGHDPNSTRKLSYYNCFGRLHPKRTNAPKRCDNTIHRCDRIDSIIFDELRGLRLADVKAYRQGQKEPDKVSALQKELSKIDKQRTRILNLYTLGSFEIDELSAKVNELNAAKASIEQQLSDIKQRPLDELTPILNSIGDIIDYGTPEQKRQLIDALIDHVEIDGDDITIYWNFD